jgi:type II secretory pathway component PulF
MESQRHFFSAIVTPLKLRLRRMSFPARTRAQVWRMVAHLASSTDYILNTAFLATADVMEQSGKKGVATILRDLEEGLQTNEFAKRARAYVSPSEALMLTSINDGDAIELLRGTARLALMQNKQSRALRGAMAQPMAIIVLLMAIFYQIGSNVFPLLSGIVNLDNAPTQMRLTSATSQWFVDNVTWVLIPPILLILLINYSMPRWTGKGRVFAEKFPPYSLYKIGQGTGFILTVMEYARLKKTLTPGLIRTLGRGASPYLQSRFNAIAEEMEYARWGNAMAATGHGFPSKDLILVTCALDNTEDWEESFASFLEDWLEESELRIKATTRGLNFTLIITLVAIIGSLITTMGSLPTLMNQ